MALDKIIKVFSCIQKLSQHKGDEGKITMYDDVKNGIAFEKLQVQKTKTSALLFQYIPGLKN